MTTYMPGQLATVATPNNSVGPGNMSAATAGSSSPNISYGATNNQSTAQNLAGQLDSTLPTVNPAQNQALVTPQATPNPNSATTSSATFPGVVSNLANTSAASSAAATQAQQATAQAGLLNPALAANAAAIQQNYAQQEQAALNAGGPQEGGLLYGGGGPIGLGAAGQVQAAINAYQTNLQGQETQALNANAQGLTAANQQASAESAAGNLANTQQGLVQSGLTSAGSLMQPSGTFPFVFDPTTGSFSVSGGNLQTAISGGVQQAVANPGLYTSLNNAITSTYGSAAAGMFQQAYIAAGGNPNTAAGQAAGAQAVAAAPGQATASNIGTAGTAGTSANAAGLSTAIQTYGPASASYQTVTAQGQALQQTMTSTGINSGVPAWNQPINSLANQLGSANYTSFQAALTETQQAYTTLLGAVGAATPTVNGQAATSLLTTSSTPNQINAALYQLSLAAYNKLEPMYNLIQTYQSGAQSAAGTSGSSSGSFTVGQTAAGGTLTWNGSSWVPSQ